MKKINKLFAVIALAGMAASTWVMAMPDDDMDCDLECTWECRERGACS